MLLEALEQGAVADVDLCLNIGVAARRAALDDVAVEFLERVVKLEESHVLARRLLLTLRPSAEVVQSSASDDVAYARMLFDQDAGGYERAMLTVCVCVEWLSGVSPVECVCVCVCVCLCV